MVRKKPVAVKLQSDSIVNIRPKRRTSTIKTSYNVNTTEKRNEFLIGKLLIGVTSNVLVEKWMSCRATFNCTRNEVDSLHLEFDEVSVLVTLIIDTQFLKEIFQAKIFSFSFSMTSEDLFMGIYFIRLPLAKFNNTVGLCLKTLFSMIFKIEECDEQTDSNSSEKHLSGSHEIDNLYNMIKECRHEFESNFVAVQHARLKPTLTPYQEDAVKWMLHRENLNLNEKEILHPMYVPVKLDSGLEIFFDKYTGYVIDIKPLVFTNHKGGILADEMGLGKTVEVLACILNHPSTLSTISQSKLKESEESEDGNISLDNPEDEPTIEKQNKKCKPLPKKRKTEESDNLDKSKRIKIEVDQSKIPKNKTSTQIALQMWYNSLLSEVNVNPIRRKNEYKNKVQCICGDVSENGIVECVDCKKFQHEACLGYDKTYGAYHCPQCWMEKPLVESGATLIVTPISLRTQWCNEIRNHLNVGLKVLQYEGAGRSPIYPIKLQEYDVVITTYNVLQAELRLTENGKEIELRRQKKYLAPGSPLTRIKWWRLCLDEAQTVETPGRMISTMAQKITAHLRWAVTGTPISKDVSDLYGLIDYLQMDPYNELDTWTHKLYNPYLRGNKQPMCAFLSEVMWRSSKADVVDQINIPKQTIQEHALEFSAVEKFFYAREHELSSNAFLQKLEKIDVTTTLQRLDRSTLKNIMAPLLSLRQACNHPNTVRGKYLATKKQVSSMKDLLEALILKNTTDSEENLRLVVSSLNGLAGIYLLLQNPVQSVEEYRKVVRLSTRFSEDKTDIKVKVDKLQLIHAMHNLADLIDAHPGISRTLRDENLRDECRELEQKYIGKFIQQTTTAYVESEKSQDTTFKLRESFILKPGQWYSDGFEWVVIENHFDEFLNKIRNSHDTINLKCTVDLRSERRILYHMATWDEEINVLRQETIDVVNGLFKYCSEKTYKIVIDGALVESAADCHLRPDDRDKSIKCPICQTNDHLKKYEYKLFAMTKRTITHAEMSLKGSWKPTSQELIFRSLYLLLKAKLKNADIIKDAEIHMTLLENLKKEFKELRKLWTFVDQQVCAQDELGMCKIRLSLKEPEKSTTVNKNQHNILKNLSYILENKLQNIHLLSEHELEYHRSILLSDEVDAMAKLEKSLGVQSYLETLRQQQYEGHNPDPCPICKNPLDQHWSILSCGHTYCLECIQILLEQTSGMSIVCSVCRNKFTINDVSYIKSEDTENENVDLRIKGNFSTKIEAVIKLLIDLKMQDEDVKVLVFSTWISVLKFLHGALENNNIDSEIMLPSNLESRIERFKDTKSNITALLLPIHLGGKGLNLIEATHVILVEPLLNPADELQAIGRVHRIGQTRPTFVHKFLVKNTIEESIYRATSSNAQNWDKNKLTLQQLKDLFQAPEERIPAIENGPSEMSNVTN